MTVSSGNAAIDADHPVRDILARLAGLTGNGRVSVQRILSCFGEASFLPALLVPALIVVSPLSGIFFLPTVMGLSIALIAAQMLSGRRTLWLPEILLRQGVSGARLRQAVGWLERPGAWIDGLTTPRLGVLFVWPLRLVPVLGCLVAGLMMPFLELVPLSSTVLGLAVTLFAVAILARDGLFVIAGLALIAVASLIPLVIVHRFG
ncbi:MAG: exopolysaccharide biosynthesis protein [Rubellimicrobium sp.]|nr:exopolysaccharide biosynthesis protein [Rubellimicrobium sp.]